MLFALAFRQGRKRECKSERRTANGGIKANSDSGFHGGTGFRSDEVKVVSIRTLPHTPATLIGSLILIDMHRDVHGEHAKEKRNSKVT